MTIVIYLFSFFIVIYKDSMFRSLHFSLYGGMMKFIIMNHRGPQWTNDIN